MSKPEKTVEITSADIKRKLLSLGYSVAGVIPAEDFPEYDAALVARATSFPSSAKMYEFLRSMAHIPVEAKSIILRSMANSGNKRYLDAIKRHLSDEDERVREFAEWAFRKLNA